MRKLIISELSTLDGVMEAPGGEPNFIYTGWSIDYVNDEYIAHNLAGLDEAGALLFGRKTFESFEEAFSVVDEANPFSVKMAALDKYVVSQTLAETRWAGTTMISSEIVERVKALKAQDGKPILVNGSRELVQLLLQHDLVDEIQLLIHPVILGVGERIYTQIGERKKLELLDVKRFDTGIVVLRYRVINS